MSTLTSSATLTIGESSTAVTEATLTVIPPVASTTGRGRLVHPSLGTFDYLHTPDSWTNIDGDVVVPPIWSSTKTLKGSANTLFVGDLRDVEVEERWDQEISMKMEHLRALMAFWMNPPDPTLGYVLWYPNYTTLLSYKVILLDLTAGGKGVTLNSVSKQGWVTGEVVLKMKIAGRNL